MKRAILGAIAQTILFSRIGQITDNKKEALLEQDFFGFREERVPPIPRRISER
jgi:hypothetical protein